MCAALRVRQLKACTSTASGRARPIGKRKFQRKLKDAKAGHAASARSSEEAHPPLASPGKRLRTKSPAPAAPGLSPTATSIGGSSSSAGANKQLAWKSQPHKCAGRAAEAIIAETESFPRMKNPEQGPRYPSCALDASAAGFVLNWGNPTELTVRLPARGAVPQQGYKNCQMLAQSVALVKNGQFTQPGQILRLVVVGLYRKISGFRNRTPYVDRLVATGAVRKSSAEDLCLGLFEPWMLGLSAPFLLLHEKARRQVVKGPVGRLSSPAELRDCELFQQVAFSSQGLSSALGRAFKLPLRPSKIANGFLQPR